MGNIKVVNCKVTYLKLFILISILFVESRANPHDLGDGFDHLVAHTLSCTIEDEVVCAKKYGSIYFGSFDEVSIGDDLGCLNEANIRRLEA